MPYCTNCGQQIPTDARICPNCNYPVGATLPVPPPQPTQPTQPVQPSQWSQPPVPSFDQPQVFPSGVIAAPRTDGQAVAALILGIVGFVVCWPVIPIIAIVLGRQAQKRIDGSGGVLGGLGMAKAGWILGIIALVFGGLLIVLLAALGIFGALMTTPGDF